MASTSNNISELGADGQPLSLPEPPKAEEEEEAKELDLSSGEAAVKLNHLGPLVVNQDGTLSRISNWQQMTDMEKKNTLRILGKRNQLRMEALKGKDEHMEGKRAL